jgi:hypothetical protein
MQLSDTGLAMGLLMETAAHLLRRPWLWDKRRHEQALFRGSADPASSSRVCKRPCGSLYASLQTGEPFSTAKESLLTRGDNLPGLVARPHSVQQ